MLSCCKVQRYICCAEFCYKYVNDVNLVHYTSVIVCLCFIVAVAFVQFGGKLEYYAPPLTDEDFNKPVGKFSQTVFLRNCSRALTATSIGNMIVWDANKFVTLGVVYCH